MELNSRRVIVVKEKERYSAKERFEQCSAVEVAWHRIAIFCAWVGKHLPNLCEWRQACEGDEVWRYPREELTSWI